MAVKQLTLTVDDGQQWVATSLTFWGVFVTILTGLLPALNSIFPHAHITPDWIAGLDQAIKGIISSLGVVFGLFLVVVDRLKGTGEEKKQLVLKPTEQVKHGFKMILEG